ncbi:MAG: hypothetical protein LQ346_003228 [Caloplaca aetnensis]|nr:MAG: hypothetical protein LQ346_003228 [Caloplaca aetnensis]
MVIEIGYPGHPIGYYFPGSSNTTFNVDYLKFWLAMAIVEIFLEITILVLPVREVYQLQLSRKKKLLCSLVFALGGFVIITGIVRIAKVYHPGETDFDLTQGDIWLNVHLGTAIICACLPTYRPLISRHSWSKMHSKRSGHSSKTSDNTHTLPSRHTVAHLGDYNELMAGLPMGQQPNSQGNFAEARRSESTDGTRGEWQHESPVKAGEAIRVKQTVDVV